MDGLSATVRLYKQGCVYKKSEQKELFKLSEREILTFTVSLGVVFNDVYAASKFAMEGFCESLAVQLLKFNVT